MAKVKVFVALKRGVDTFFPSQAANQIKLKSHHMKLITWHEMKSEKSSTLKRAIAAFRSKNPGFYTPVKTKVQALNESSSAATGGNATPQEGAR